MLQFDYSEQLNKTATPEIVMAIRKIDEHRSKHSVYESMVPNVLDGLVETAKIQSTSASNEIENISTSNKRLRELMTEKTEPRNRDEREIAGYRYVLDMVHESHDDIPVTPNVILQLHRDLYRFSDNAFAGRWKDSDNVIAERSPSGELVIRLRPTSAAATPGAIAKICDEYNQQLQEKNHDPLLGALLFVFDFVSIHPFNDGNGRMSRLLTLLLLYRCGYTVGKYISIEKEIEKTKETYYEALAASSARWHDGENNYTPFVTYMLGVITACYKELDLRFAATAKPRSNEELLRDYFNCLVDTVTKYEIMDANPTMSKRTIERILKKLQDEGAVAKVGAARATAYRRVR